MTKQDDFLNLYEGAHDDLTRYCHALTGNEDDAKDLVNETVLRAFEGFHKIKDRTVFTRYLIGVSRRIYFNHLRRQKFWGAFSAPQAEMIPDNQKTDVSIEVRILYEALGKLPAKQKEAVILFEISGFSLKEIAEIQQSGLSAVKARIARGRNKLSDLLRDREVQLEEKSKSYEQQTIIC